MDKWSLDIFERSREATSEAKLPTTPPVCFFSSTHGWERDVFCLPTSPLLGGQGVGPWMASGLTHGKAVCHVTSTDPIHHGIINTITF